MRCLARDPRRATLPARAEVVRGDVLDEAHAAAALDGVDVAYYLVHSMGGDGDGDFAARDRAGAAAFGARPRAAGVRASSTSAAWRAASPSTCAAARRSRASWPPRCPGRVHARAAMVIGAGSASFLILRHLVDRLPAMVCPRWIDTRTQPIAIRDVVAALAGLRSATRAARARSSSAAPTSSATAT